MVLASKRTRRGPADAIALGVVIEARDLAVVANDLAQLIDRVIHAGDARQRNRNDQKTSIGFLCVAQVQRSLHILRWKRDLR